MPDDDPARRVRCLVAPLRHRERRARGDSHHRRLAGLRRDRQARLPPRGTQPASRARPWRGRRSTATRRTPRRLAGAAMAARHPSRARRRRSPTATSTSSRSASTGEDPAAGGWSSTACSSSPSGTSPCATETWSSTPSPSPGRQLLPGHEATRRPWTGHAPGARGERPDLVKSAQMDFPNSRYAGGCGGSAACAGTRFGASGSPRRRITLRALRHPHRRRG